jgi:hypothetical protein
MNAVSPRYGLGQLNHYWNKSFEEFIAKRMRGNTADSDKFFFQWGNMGDDGSPDPVPPILVERTRCELDRLMAIPEIRECVSRANRGFDQQLAHYDAEFGTEKRYNEARAAALAR